MGHTTQCLLFVYRLFCIQIRLPSDLERIALENIPLVTIPFDPNYTAFRERYIGDLSLKIS